MTALDSPSTSAAACAIRPPTALVDASTRAPLMLMAGASVKWLLVSLIAGMIALIKLHAPGMLSGIPALTYGRLVALQDSVFIYGFASQAAMAVAVWLICRLGGTVLIGRGAVVVSALIWNFGVLVGAVGILAGQLSPFQHFQFPYGAIATLLVAYCVYGVAVFMTFEARRECAMYPSLWFVLAGIVFFPWILASAAMTLWSPEIRGSISPITAGWAANNIVTVWLGSIALAALFYLLPKLTGKSLYSYALAVFAFWLYILFAQMGGMHNSAAFPAWVVGLSEISTMLLLIPGAAIALNWFYTLGGKGGKKSTDAAFRFAWWGALFFVLWIAIAAVGALQAVDRIVEFTVFHSGVTQLALLGFFTMSMFAAFIYILPRVAETEWPRATRLHFTLTLIGAILVFASMLLGGFLQGSKAANLSNDHLEAVRTAGHLMGLAIIGYLLLIVAQFSFLANLSRLFIGTCCRPDNGGAR